MLSSRPVLSRLLRAFAIAACLGSGSPAWASELLQELTATRIGQDIFMTGAGNRLVSELSGIDLPEVTTWDSRAKIGAFLYFLNDEDRKAERAQLIRQLERAFRDLVSNPGAEPGSEPYALALEKRAAQALNLNGTGTGLRLLWLTGGMDLIPEGNSLLHDEGFQAQMREYQRGNKFSLPASSALEYHNDIELNRIQLLPDDRTRVVYPSLSPDGSKLVGTPSFTQVSLGSGGTQVGFENMDIRVWSTETGLLISKLETRYPDEEPYFFSFSPDGTRLIAGVKKVSRRGTTRSSVKYIARIWDPQTGRILSEIPSVRGKTLPYLSSLSLSLDRRFLMLGGESSFLALCDLESDPNCDSAIPMKGKNGWTLSTALSPVPRHAINVSQEGMFKLWNTSTGEEIRGSRNSSVKYRSAAFSTDGEFYALGGQGGTVRLESVAGDKVPAFFKETRLGSSLSLKPQGIEELSFSPDGSKLLAKAVSGELWVLDGDDLEVLLYLKAFPSNAIAQLMGSSSRLVVFLPDEGTLAEYSVPNVCEKRLAGTGESR